MKLLFLLLTCVCFYECDAQKPGVNDLIGKWRVCKADAAPLVYIFSNNSEGEKGLLREWNDPSVFIYKRPFTYTIAEAPKDSLTGNPVIDENLFVMTITSTTVTGKPDVQTFFVTIAGKDSMGFIVKPGFITRYCKVAK